MKVQSQVLYVCLCSHRCSMCISASSSRSVAVCVRSGGVLLGVGEHQALSESIKRGWLQSDQLGVTVSHLRQQRAEIHPDEQRQTFRQLQKRPLLCYYSSVLMLPQHRKRGYSRGLQLYTPAHLTHLLSCKDVCFVFFYSQNICR